jgi:glycosyltransferase involved in cell wall biosynthesis
MTTTSLDLLLAVHNCADYVAKCLESIQSQTIHNWHLVVVDDASTDDTPQIIRRFADDDSRIQIIRNKINIGLPASLNRGLQFCETALVARVDADDVFHPEKLERQFTFMQQHPDIGLVGTACNHIDSNGAITGATSHPHQDAEIRFALPFGCTFVHPSVMMRRELVAQAHGYDESMWTGQDYRLWADLSQITRMHNLPERLMDYRVHPASITQSPERARLHDKLKLPIHTELLSRYLGRPLSGDEAHCLVQMVSPSKELTPIEVKLGVDLAFEYLSKTIEMENSDIVASFRTRLVEGFLAQAGFQNSKNTATTRMLLQNVGRLQASALISFRSLRLLARVSLPRKFAERVRAPRGLIKPG